METIAFTSSAFPSYFRISMFHRCYTDPCHITYTYLFIRVHASNIESTVYNNDENNVL